MQQPKMAIITQSTLEGIGLAGLLGRIMPVGEVEIFNTLDALMMEHRPEEYIHFFISSRTLMENANFFLSRPRTIVLTHGKEKLPLEGFHTLNVQQPEELLVRDVLAMASRGHRPPSDTQARQTPLTPRETEVLCFVVRGLLNKEIADKMGVAVTTIISHRKNLTRKLGMRSVGALTVYAVTHGLINLEDIPSKL